MKKIFCMLLATTLLTTSTFATTAEVGANADHTQMIAKTFNEFRYRMTVNVDPNSPDYQTKAVTEFKARMAQLQNSGVQPAEVMDYMRNSMLDASARKDFDRLLSSMTSNNISSEEAGNVAMQFMAKKYQEGTSYSGGGSGSYKGALVVIGIVIVGVVTYLVIRNNNNHNTTTTDTTTDTTTRTNTTTTTTTVTDTNTNTNCCYYNELTQQYCCD